MEEVLFVLIPDPVSVKVTTAHVSAGFGLPPVDTFASALSPISVDLNKRTPSRKGKNSVSSILRRKRSGTSLSSSAKAEVQPISNVGDTPSVSVSSGT